MNLSTYINLRLPGCSILGLHYFSASVSRRKGSAGQVCLSGRRLASCLFFSIYLCRPELTHVRPLVISASRWESGETDGQMWGLRCVSHIKDSFLGSCWEGSTSGLYGLIKPPYIYTVDTHWWRPLRLCLHEETLLFLIQKSVCLVLILVFQTFLCPPPPQREPRQLSGPARAHPQTPIKLC